MMTSMPKMTLVYLEMGSLHWAEFLKNAVAEVGPKVLCLQQDLES